MRAAKRRIHCPDVREKPESRRLRWSKIDLQPNNCLTSPRGAGRLVQLAGAEKFHGWNGIFREMHDARSDPGFVTPGSKEAVKSGKVSPMA